MNKRLTWLTYAISNVLQILCPRLSLEFLERNGEGEEEETGLTERECPKALSPPFVIAGT